MKKRILVVYSSSVLSPLAQPHGAVIVSTVLKSAGFDVKLVCPFWRMGEEKSLLSDIKDFSPDMIAISIRNHGTAGFDYREMAEKSFCSEIKKIIAVCLSVNNAPIILGGSGFSVDPLRYVNIKGVSAGFVGNAEWELKEFALRFLNKSEDIRQAVKNISSAVLPGKRISPTPSSGVEPGAYDLLFCSEGIKTALAVGGTIPFRTKTGCGGRCVYCVVPRIEARNFRSPRKVVIEIKKAVEYNLGNRLFCADSEVGQDPEHDKAVCQAIVKSGLGKKIRVDGYADPLYMDKEMVNLMMMAGWKEVSLNVDSLSEKIRKSYRKRGTVTEVEKGIKNLLRFGEMKVTLNILLGGPEESFETIAETATALRKWEEKVDVCFTFGMTVFPNTPLQKIAKRRNYARYFLEESGDRLASFCSPCSPLEMIDYLKSEGLVLSQTKKLVFWNENIHQRDVEFTKRVVRIANGYSEDEESFAPTSNLQKLMLEVANHIGKRR